MGPASGASTAHDGHNTAKISLEATILIAESSDLLEEGEGLSAASKLIKIPAVPDPHRDESSGGGLSVEQKTAAMKAAQKDADHFEDKLLKQVKDLVPRVGKASAGGQAGQRQSGRPGREEGQGTFRRNRRNPRRLRPRHSQGGRKGDQEEVRLEREKQRATGGFRGIT